MLFRWEVIDEEIGDLADAGMNLLLLAADGRIERDHQFVLGITCSLGDEAGAR